MRRRIERARRRGFTLVEVIIALTLMSLIMLGLVSAFATMGKSAARLDERAGVSGREWLLSGFLRESLSSATRQFRLKQPDGSETAYFRGDATSLQWLGLMPARHGVGGLYLFSLGVESGRGGRSLVLRYEPFVRDAVVGKAGSEALELGGNVEGVNIAYQSRPERLGDEPVWYEKWDEEGKLPARVRIEVTIGGASWPTIIVALGAVDAVGRRGSAVTANPPSVGG
ncbi:MAG: prepilin-type N-terminal cleavage/methylation domain-containing protein [Azoarcus sp.]|jgi:general secretion pathway protein J|nr:prepilin-type N-terminal cleavage/methylation domain-containing protein [Azoarcus sp.]